MPESEQTKGFLTNLKERVFGAQGELDDTPEHTQCTEGLALAPPTWEPNNGRTGTALCLICASSFGMLKRKHHCRNCGRLVCASCSEKRCVRFGAVGRNQLTFDIAQVAAKHAASGVQQEFGAVPTDRPTIQQ